MRQTYIKKNSATQLTADAFIKAVSEVLRAASINFDDRSEVLFETGCRMVERWIRSEYMRHYLLENEESAFWDFWVTEFVKDDEALLRYTPRVFREYEYIAIKMWMTESQDVVDNFVRFVSPLSEPAYHGKV